MFRFVSQIFNSQADETQPGHEPESLPRARRVLNVGGNNKNIPIPAQYEGWEHILLDIDPKGSPDVVCDARDLTDLPEADYDSVYCSHNLEHYYRHDVAKVLAGFHHVLKDDGFAHILVPDIGELVKIMAQRCLDIDDLLYLSPNGPITVGDIIYGQSEEIERSGQDFYAHKTGFTQKSLEAILLKAGFNTVFSRAQNLEISIVAFKDKPSDYAVALFNLLDAPSDEPGRASWALSNIAIESVAHKKRGNEFLAQGMLVEATECYKQAIAVNPGYAEGFLNLGFALKELEQYQDAERYLRQAVRIDSSLVDAYFLLGTIAQARGNLTVAIQHYRRTLELKPDFVEAHASLGNAYMEQGNVDKAVESYRVVRSLDPDAADPNSTLLYAQSFLAGYSPTQYLAEAKSYGSIVSALARPYTSWAVDLADKDVPRLRVGLVSGDFRNHPVGYFLENILAHLNPARVELVAYSTVSQEDEITARIKHLFSAWNSIAELDDEAAARKIRNDGVHILIDLAGHTDHNRLPLFAWKPAPVQVSWLGYFASTGVPGMDFLLADPISVPESNKDQFSETIWYLPDSRLCFTPPTTSARVIPTPPPALHNGFITFGCYQNANKINASVLALWGRIFHALPQARLRLQSKQMRDPATREHLLQQLTLAGIVRERVAIVEPTTREDYLAGHADVDIILDTFPYPGGTTTCEALWMGVPTVTLAGNTMLSRQGASLLTCAGLEEWVAGTEDEYVALAVAHASDVNRLVHLRSGLRQKVLASPLFDASRFALNLEDALYGMWRHARSQTSPSHDV